mgnify:CR=1 FL=1
MQQGSGTTWNIFNVDSGLGTNNITTCNNIAIDSSGNPHICYYVEATKDLKYAKGTWSGSNITWEKRTVDSDNQVGLFNDIAVDSYGNPHIVYFDDTLKKVKYAKGTWSGSNITWNIQQIASCYGNGWGSRFASIVLDSAGKPHISFCDRDTDNVFYATKQ